MTEKKSFGFRVKREDVGWSVTLPHQCDRWEITGDTSGPAAHHEVAIQQMEHFIEEARVAIGFLRSGREYGA